jgi:hypothetical protein
MESYVLVWSCLLTASLIAFRPPWGYINIPLYLIAGYRVFDIAAYRIHFFLTKSRTRPWTPERSRRSLLIASINFYEVVVAFAAVYHCSGLVGLGGDRSIPLPSPLAAVYFSAITMLTVGYGDFAPVDDWGRLLVMVQLCCSVLFVLYLLPSIVALLFSRDAANSPDHNS